MLSSQPCFSAQVAVRLDVRRCKVVSGDGSIATRESVYCPLRERAASLKECSSCERCRGIEVDPAAQRLYIDCGLEPEIARPEEPDARMAEGACASASPVAEIMSRETLCVHADMALPTIEEILLSDDLTCVPVVDEEGRPLGMLSRSDLLRFRRARGASLGGPLRGVASEAMTQPVLTLNESSTVTQAAALMAFEEIHRLPVVSNDGRVVGVLSSLDVLRWLGRRCGYLIPGRKAQALP